MAWQPSFASLSTCRAGHCMASKYHGITEEELLGKAATVAKCRAVLTWQSKYRACIWHSTLAFAQYGNYRAKHLHGRKQHGLVNAGRSKLHSLSACHAFTNQAVCQQSKRLVTVNKPVVLNKPVSSQQSAVSSGQSAGSQSVSRSAVSM